MRRLILVLAILALPAAALGWFGWDVLTDRRVPPGVYLEDTAMGRVDIDAVRSQVAELASAALAADVTVTLPDGSMSFTAGGLGMVVDQEATVDAVMSARRDGSMVEDLAAWITSPWSSTTVELDWSLDQDRAVAALSDHAGALVSEPEEPHVVIDDGEIVVRPGVPGSELDDAATAAAIESALVPGRPLTIEAVLTPVQPATADATALDFAAEVEAATSSGVVVRLFDTVGRISAGTLRANTVIEFGDGDPVFTFDPDGLSAALDRLFGDVSRPGSDPVFDVVDGRPTVVETGSAPLGCCAPEAGEVLAAALLAGQSGTVDIPPAPIGDPELESWANGGGVVEVVGEFTTNHACCQSRVSNIHRIADLIRGVYLLPGESFSINDYVGERTEEKGFVSAGVIERGSFTEDVGGGISQFATTFFNAAFFAGLDLDEYQSHSIYISRYPYGREATLSYPLPDLEVTNSTGYPVLVWTSYTDTSITVTMYSTSHIVVEQTGQSEEPFGACTQVETFRRRTYPDGRVVDDSVSARYRPGEGLDCNGNPVGT